MKKITEIFGGTKSKLIKHTIDLGGDILGIKIEDFAGVLVKEREFASNLAKKMDNEVGVRGYISTDELPAYGITKEEKENIKSIFEAGENDVVIFVADIEEKGKKALELAEKEIGEYKKSHG